MKVVFRKQRMRTRARKGGGKVRKVRRFPRIGHRFVFHVRGRKQNAPLLVTEQRGAVYEKVGGFYFLGVRAKVSSTKRQYLSTEGIKQRSLGVWGDSRVGPKETTSMLGQWLKITEHSKPA